MHGEGGGKEGRTKVYSEKRSEQSQSGVTRARCVPGRSTGLGADPSSPAS